MLDRCAELSAFMRQYEQATNRHDFNRLAPLIADDATYWFTEGSHHGIDAIRTAARRSAPEDRLECESHVSAPPQPVPGVS